MQESIFIKDHLGTTTGIQSSLASACAPLKKGAALKRKTALEPKGGSGQGKRFERRWYSLRDYPCKGCFGFRVFRANLRTQGFQG